MDSISSSCPPLKRSRLTHRDPFLLIASKSQLFPSNPIFIFFFLFLFSVFTSSASSDSTSQTTYTRLCNDVVPASLIRSNAPKAPSSVADSLRFQSGYFAGGTDRIFNRSAGSVYSKRISFRATSVRRTQNDDVFELRAQLHLQQRTPNPNTIPVDPGRLLLKRVYHGRKVSNWRVSQWIRASLSGFWSRSSGKLCMFGKGSYGNINVGDSNVVLKLSYPLDLTVLNSLVSGTLESFDDSNNLNYFEPISILAMSLSSNYRFTLVGNGNGNGCVGDSNGESLPLGNLRQGACTVFHGLMDRFAMEYESNCSGVTCNPLGGAVGKLPEFMYFNGIRCSNRQRIQMLLGFPDSSYRDPMFPFYPNTTLISEGVWDENEKRLCAVACRILNFTTGAWGNPYVGDCSIKLTLRFPAVLTLRNRSIVQGKIWSDKRAGESGYFGKTGFGGSLKLSRGLQGLQYMYTEIDRVRKYCAEKMTDSGRQKAYPDGYSSDMQFNLLVKNSKGQLAPGYSSPLFVTDQNYDERLYGVPSMLTTGGKAHIVQPDTYVNLLNVSYTMSFNPPPDFKLDGQISSAEVKVDAEGLYNRNNGLLCMIGCQHLRSSDKILIRNETLDCEIMINIQFSPLNAKGGQSVKGAIESTRQKSDPYYFDPLQLSSISIYPSQAEASIWRMDFEIIMLLVSNTLACVFVGLQLLHVKKQPDKLPYISVVMLAVITLGHMIPLILNFEALFMGNHGQQNVFLRNEGWLEVNEVVVRMVTMVAFLLELHLLQLTWSSRQGEGSHSGLWVSEKKVLHVTLPLYIGGGLITWFVHTKKNSRRFRPFRLLRHKFRLPRGQAYQPPSFWQDFKSYAGLLLDGFLLPQILFNMIFNSEGKPLSSSFYVGTTIVRILPHAYDLYRAHSSAWYLDLSYIYANHRMDFYSTAWDIIIPIGGILFAVFVYLQQRFGSRCILPKRIGGSSVYEKVPAIGNDEL